MAEGEENFEFFNAEYEDNNVTTLQLWNPAIAFYEGIPIFQQ